MELNPFFHRGPIRDQAYFFGRQEELACLYELLRQGQSVAVSGPRRFGKTSLLFHLMTPETMTQHGLQPAQTKWVYLDGGLLAGLGEEGVYGAVERDLGFDTSDTDCVSFMQLRERVQQLASDGQRLIIGFDEFELVAANLQLDPNMFYRLRGLAAQYGVQFVVLSREPISTLSFDNRQVLSSPFFNIFVPMHLPLLRDDEAIELITTLAARGGQPFEPNTIDFLLDLVGPHPLFVQVGAYYAFSAQRHGLLSDEARRRVRERALAELEGHFMYYWRTLSSQEQYALAALPLTGLIGHSPAVRRLRELGLVDSEGYLGLALRDFVQRQHVEGLLHGGPFIMDVHRRLLSVNGQDLHLTPTEFAALRLFLQSPGQLITPEEIEAALWPADIAPDPERARGVVKKLRAALGSAGERILNRRGQGYVLGLD